MEKFEFIIAQGENYPAAITSVNENVRRLYFGVNCFIRAVTVNYEAVPSKVQTAMPKIICYATALVAFPGAETDEMPGMESPPEKGTGLKSV